MLADIRFVLCTIWYVRCNIHQSGNRWIRARFGNHGSPIAVSDKNALPILQGKNAFRCRHVILEGRLGLLDDADVEAIFDKNVVNAPPAGTVRPGPVNQHNIANALILG
jgi:hypothetical protein